MDKKSKILIGVIAILIVVSVFATYWRIMVKKDYFISAQTDCDPYVDKCFVWECDPESAEEGEACTGDPEADIWYFQVIHRKAFNIPLCDPNAEDCEALVCPEGEADCEYEFCTDENMEEQYASSCSDPLVYAEENPLEEDEVVECEEGDTECEAAAAEEACDAETDEGCAAEEDAAAAGEEEAADAENAAETPAE